MFCKYEIASRLYPPPPSSTMRNELQNAVLIFFSIFSENSFSL
jgi:hypothetical protein